MKVIFEVRSKERFSLRSILLEMDDCCRDTFFPSDTTKQELFL